MPDGPGATLKTGVPTAIRGNCPFLSLEILVLKRPSKKAPAVRGGFLRLSFEPFETHRTLVPRCKTMRRFAIRSVAALAIGILVAGLSSAQDDQAQRPGPAPVAGSEDFRSDNPLRESDVQTRSENRRPAPAAAMRLPAPGRSNGATRQTDVRRYEGATDERREYRSSEPARTQRGTRPDRRRPD